MNLKNINKVFEFMYKFEQTINDTETVPPLKTRILRYKLIEEERNELIEAFFHKEDNYNEYLIQVADAITDLLYVVYGIYGDYGCKIYEYKVEDIDNIIFDNLQLPDNDEYVIDMIVFKTIPCFCHELYQSLMDSDFDKISGSIVFIERLLYKLCELYDFPLDKLFEEVHNSNMSKLHDGKVVKNEFGKVIKSPDYKPANIKSIINKV